MFGTKSLNDEHYSNVVSMNSLNSMMLMICKATSLGKLCLMKMIFFVPPSFDEKIYCDEIMPPIYDDYIDESGFGEVMTLFNDESTILEEVSINYDKKFLSMRIMVMTCML